MEQPTEAQIKEFWEWCGIKYEPDQDVFKVIFPNGEWYNFGDNWKMVNIEPPIDLNNLFKYAVPKLGICDKIILDWSPVKGCRDFSAEIVLWRSNGNHQHIKWTEHDDLALALFWVIFEVIKGGKDGK